MKTISIDNKHYIPAKVMMLPNTGDIINPLVILRNDGVLVFYDETFHRIRMAHQEFGDFEIQNASYQHLYLVCDLPIKENDWMLDTVQSYLPSSIERASKENIYILNIPEQGWKKVIAATDIKLQKYKYTKEELDGHNPINYGVPQFPQSFIKEFVEIQGKDVDVLVEVDLLIAHDKEGNKLIEPDIKLNPDNTVNLIFK